VRVSGFDYADSGLHADFWRPKEHEEMASLCDERIMETDEESIPRFQREVMEEMLRLGGELGEEGLGRCLRAFLSRNRWVIPALTERVKYKGRDAWVFVANWGLGYGHIVLEVVDEETCGRFFFERCR
jgi:hypothetical protein